MNNQLLVLFLMSSLISYSQVGIGTTTPSPASMLEISGGSLGNYRGFMPPRVPDTAAQLDINPDLEEAGLLVFVSSTGCLTIWNGTSWENLSCAGENANVWINELHYDNTGSDEGEFVEIAGTAGIDLTNFRILLYNGLTLEVYQEIYISAGTTIPDEGNGYGSLSFDVTFFQNGATTTSSIGDGLAIADAFNNVLQYISYEGLIGAINGPAEGSSSEEIPVSENDSTPIGASIGLEGAGTQYLDFNWTTFSSDSKGTVNTGQTFN